MSAHSPDPYLVELVDYVNHSGRRIAVRVSVRGRVLAGHLIAATEWMAAQSADATRAAGAEWLGLRLGEMARDLKDSFDASEDDGGRPHYLHLMEAATPEGAAGAGVEDGATDATWRVRLDSVDAWSLGLA